MNMTQTEEINQLIRATQVVRVRALNLSGDVRKLAGGAEQAKKLEAAVELVRDAQSKLEQVRAYYD